MTAAVQFSSCKQSKGYETLVRLPMR